ncbi:hypothetical protein [Alteribacillus sp. YIM 98480]|uniref:hypothetical protein n=1 Tax=Alteribacillus sp. YIM 98480 TaxID=2606599 RepID=UPI00131C1353|nr:hypothetical protein [Alteribacillus sp. YIM 98480]
MKYWLVSASETDRGKINMKIENQSILYRGRHQFDTTIKINAKGFRIEPAKVAIGGAVKQFCGNDSVERWKKLIRKGITTSLMIMPISKIKKIEKITEESLSCLDKAPIDFILVPSINSRDFTPEVVKWLIKNNYPMVEVFFTSLKECQYVSWDWVKQAVGPSSISFTFCFPPLYTKEDLRLKENWETALSQLFNIVTFQRGAALNKDEMQITGVYPSKGTIARGDADYLLYYDFKREQIENEVSAKMGQEPDIVVLRGKVLKAGSHIQIGEGFGRCCNDFLPGRLRSINGV